MKNKDYTPDLAKKEFDKKTEFIDVREPDEFSQARIPGAKLIPMSEMNSRINEIPNDREVVIYCRTGNRSAYLVNILEQNGYTNLINLSGGIVSWYENGYPVDTTPAGETYHAAAFEDLDVDEVNQRLSKNNAVLIDVREPYEFDDVRAPKSINIPLSRIPEEIHKYEKDKNIYLICNSGNRSAMAANWLAQNGFSNVVNVEGGIYAWQSKGFPVE